ncbi:hypothetical protein [Microbacterium hydrocarbonoxydans]|uniref:hypothetical protein n=1 Tax=Microbacterium hydrocarbonoxydans TaxID=273678 RepID=UPI0007BC39D5|nr:hypothetical protein [Microbacterium hydrocarbonoxydans]GAT73650.1 hypothetical protein MHM582_2144 [Microbacterium sp. HM58-2]
MRPAASAWLAGAGLVLVAGLVSGLTPAEESLYDPVLVRAGAGEQATGRTLIAAVAGTSFADEIVADDGDWRAEGNWLVVEIVASAPRTEDDAEVPLATLRVDGRVYQASERPPDTMVDAQLHVGTDTVGFLAFELPDGLRSGTGELRLTSQYSTPELDDVLAFTLSLDESPSVASIELAEPRIGAP